MSTVPLCFIDTETTSLRRPWMPAGRRVWDVAAIRREPDGATTEYQHFLPADAIDLGNADPFALNIGGFWDRWRDTGAWGCIDALDEMTVGAHLVGAVPSFDEESLAHLFHEHGHSPRWHYHLIDVENLAAGALGLEPPYKSDDLFAAFGVNTPEGERHTAMGDARSAMALYDAVMRAERKIERRVG